MNPSLKGFDKIRLGYFVDSRVKHNGYPSVTDEYKHSRPAFHLIIGVAMLRAELEAEGTIKLYTSDSNVFTSYDRIQINELENEIELWILVETNKKEKK